MDQYENWTLKIDGAIARLVLDRPEAGNALNTDTLHELRDLTRELGANSELRALILEGAGKHFSTGVDVSLIRRMVGAPQEQVARDLRDLQDCLDVFEALPLPVIAGLHGFVIGGGIILAACCDFRIASRRAIFSLPEVKRGIGVVMGMQRVTRLVGVATCKEWALLGENFSAAVAYEQGLVHRLVAPEDLDAELNKLAQKFAKLPRSAVAVNKQIINRGYAMDLRESQDHEIELQLGLLDGEDFRRAMAAFFKQ